MGETAGYSAFLFTDIVGSMRLWDRDADAMQAALEIHDGRVRAAIDAHRGTVFSVGGDGFGAAFGHAGDAVAAAASIREALTTTEWPAGLDLRVRQGVHVGRAQARDGNWFGQPVNVAARVCDAAHGGQILVSADVAEEVPEADLLRLGLFELRGVGEKLALHQLGLHDHFPAPRAIDPSRDTLPEPVNLLIGRSTEVGEIRAKVEAQRLVTISGIGGLGKTRLAVEVAHRMAPTFADGVYFADLTPASCGDTMVSQIAAAVRLELLHGDLRDQAVAQVADRSALVVLDNCEHLVDEVRAFAADVLSRGGPGRMLATSRERLGVAGEHHIRLGTLATTGDGALSESARLFVDRALAIDGSFGVDDPAALNELVSRLDGLPLAIELAAARTTILSVSEILARLDDRLALLGSTRAGTGRTLETMLDWSWQLLDDTERLALAASAGFESGFDVDLLAAATALGPFEAIDVIESLVDKSLVTVDGRIGSRTRYRLLESVRAYADRRLVARGDETEIRRRIAHALLERIRATGELFASAAADPNAVLAADVATALASHQWARINGELVLAAELALHGSTLLLSIGRAVEATELLRSTADLGDELPPELRSRALLGLGLAGVQLDDFGSSIAIAEQVVDDPDPYLRTAAYALMAVPGLFNAEMATDHLVDASLEAARELEDPGVFPYLIEGFRRFGVLDMAGAADAMAPGLPADRVPQSPLQVMLTCGHAMAAALAGDYAGASATLDLLVPEDSVWDATPMLRAVIAARSGDHDLADQLLREAGSDALLGRLKRQSNDVLIGFAVLRAAQGRVDEAQRLLADALLPRNVHVFALAAQLALEIDDLDGFLDRSRRLRAEQGETRADATDALRFLLAEPG